nr:hypothetical protein HK105_000779 [Polyrhizophydium stewartii]
MFDRLQLLPWASPEGLAHAAARCRLADQLDWSEPQLLCELAVDSGAVWLLRVLVSGQDGGVPPSDVELRLDHVNRAAMNGHLGMLVLLDEYLGHLCWPKSVMDHAASGGHLHILEWLHEHRTEGCSAFAMDWAATNGHLTTVQWLHATRTEGCTKFAMDLACNNGHLATVKWLHEHRTEGCSQHAMTWAAKNGHLAIVIWLHLHRTESCDGSALTSAARNGHLRVVDFLLHHVAGVDWDLEQAFKEAMEAQHEDVCRAVFEFAKRRAGQ